MAKLLFLNKLQERLEDARKAVASLHVQQAEVMNALVMAQQEVSALEVLIKSEQKKAGLPVQTVEESQSAGLRSQGGAGATQLVMQVIEEAKTGISFDQILSKTQGHPGISRSKLHIILYRQRNSTKKIRQEGKLYIPVKVSSEAEKGLLKFKL